MSQFSEMLNRLVEESGFKPYQIEKKSGLDHKTFSAARKGQRLPSISFVNKLCDFLSITPKEKEGLLILYDIAKIGEKVYTQRKYIKNLIEQLSTINLCENDVYFKKKLTKLTKNIKQSLKVFSGKQIVNNVIHEILEAEVFSSDAPCISLNVPYEYNFLFDCLRRLYLSKHGKVEIKHIVSMIKNPHRKQNGNINLELLAHALPFAFMMGNGYQPHYYYVNDELSNHVSLAMPFYIITNTQLITLSADFETAILYNQMDTKKAYQANFQQCLNISKPFMVQTSDIKEMVAFFNSVSRCSSDTISIIEPQPCLAKYYTHDMIEQHLTKNLPGREEIKLNVCALYDGYFRNKPPLSIFFSHEGLEFLVTEGRVTDLPNSLATAFTLEERKMFLNSLKTDIKNNVINARVVDSSKFNIPSCATVQLTGENSLLISITGENGMMTCSINEVSLCSAFHDFFKALGETEISYGKEKTIEILEYFIKQLE